LFPRYAQLSIAIAIVALACVLRVEQAQTRHSMWLDEAHQFGVVTDSTNASDVLDALARFDSHPPLSYLFDWSVVQIWGPDALLSRTPYVILGTLAVALLMVMAWLRFGTACALLSGLLAACSPFLVRTSAMLRYGALVCALTPIWGMTFLRLERRRDTRSAILWGVASAIYAYASYHAMFAVIAGGLYLLARDRSRSNLRVLAVAGGVFTVCYAPWVPSLVTQMQVDRWTWAQVKPNPGEVFTTLRLVTGRNSWAILLASLVLGVLTMKRGRGALLGLSAAAFGGTFLAWAAHWVAGPYVRRLLVGFVILGLPPACWYLAQMGRTGPVAWWRGLSTGRVYRMSPRMHGSIGVVLVGVILIAQAREIRMWHTTSGISPMTMVAAKVDELERAGDVVVVSPSILATAFHHQFAGTSPVMAPPYPHPAAYRTTERVDPDMASCIERARKTLDSGGRVWLVASDRYSPRKPEEVRVRELLFRIGEPSRTFPFDDRTWWFPVYLVLVEAR